MLSRLNIIVQCYHRFVISGRGFLVVFKFLWISPMNNIIVLMIS